MTPFGPTFTVARKELRALFQSPIAILFLSVFLIGTLFLFFSQSRFFSRNLADVRPLFEWLPVLLIFLVSAVTMRSWAEERKAGTMEVLLTLPVWTSDLVLGKFLAGMALVGLALLFTVPIPLTVSYLGPLDWGPVIGGYFAALLLASSYMAIGLCVSSRTDNQVVALMMTLVLGGLLYFVGTDTFTSFFAADTGELLRQFGTGSRFESIGRGVLDLRDIAYYVALTSFFLLLNGVFLEWERLDVGSVHGQARSNAMLATVALVGLNGAALNVWLNPVNAVRIDLTAGSEYTVSPVTKSLLGNLTEPLLIHGYFSENTHPLLAPMVPQVRDLLEEYEIYGRGKVKVDAVDPNSDEAIEAEINEKFNIESIPFGVAERHSQSVVNAYFHVVVAYGDKFEVLSFEDLIDVRMDANGPTVKLKNLEYDLTRAVKKVTQDFETTESLIAKLPSQGTITAYITPSLVPEEFAETAASMRKVGQELGGLNPEKLRFQEVDPSTDRALMERLATDFGVQPLAADLFGTQRFYLHLVVQAGDNVERILPRGALNEGELRQALDAVLRRAIPGQLKKIALYTAEAQAGQRDPQMPPQMQPPEVPADYRYLEQLLGQEYTIERAQLEEGFVPEDVDTLIVGKTGPMSPRQQLAVDQFLMRGGSIIALAGAYRVSADQQGLRTEPEDPSLRELLKVYGVTVEDALVLSEEYNAPFPLPVQQRIPNGPVLQRIQLLPYPFFPDLRGDMLNPGHPALAGITAMTMPWSSPLSPVSETLEGRELTWLVRSGPDARLRTDGGIEPVNVGGDLGWNATGEPAQETLALAITGKFPSAFADRSSPLAADQSGPDTSGRTLTKSVADGRLVVIGSDELVSDLLFTLVQQLQSEQHAGNPQLIQNLVDWTVEDTGLLSIRTAGAFARTLVPLEEAEASSIEIRTWILVLLPVALVVSFPWFSRRNTLAIPLPSGVSSELS
jgi:ABC-2 type transport system permease protein